MIQDLENYERAIKTLSELAKESPEDIRQITAVAFLLARVCVRRSKDLEELRVARRVLREAEHIAA